MTLKQPNTVKPEQWGQAIDCTNELRELLTDPGVGNILVAVLNEARPQVQDDQVKLEALEQTATFMQEHIDPILRFYSLSKESLIPGLH